MKRRVKNEDPLLDKPNVKESMVTIRVPKSVVERLIRERVDELMESKGKCECEPDMERVKRIALQEKMSTHDILRLCSQISSAAKGTYDE